MILDADGNTLYGEYDLVPILDAFVKKDVELAQEVIRRDDIVDSYFLKVKYDIINLQIRQ